MSFRCQLALPIVIGVSLWVVLFGTMDVQSKSYDITVIVSENYKGTAGKEVLIPIYADFGSHAITEVSFSLYYPEILHFKNLYAPDDTSLWNSDGYFEEYARNRKVEARFVNQIPITGQRKLIYMVFDVVGPQGSVGLIQLENFSVGKPDLEIQILGSKFQVLPAVTYLPDRDTIEIVASEPFSTFELEVNQSLGLWVQGVPDTGGWFISQEGLTVEGVSSNGQAVTSLNIPVVEEGDFKFYSISFDGGTPVILKKREIFFPFVVSD